MNRRIIFIIIGALLLLALVGFLWFWFLGRDTGEGVGDLGSGNVRPIATSTGLGGGNTQSPYGYTPSTEFEGETTNQEVFIPTTDGSGGYSGGGFIEPPEYNAPGVTWLGGGTFTSFNPTPINQVNNVNISGTPYITTQPDTSDPGGLGLGGILAGAGLAGAVACTPGLLGAGVSALAGFFSGVPVNSVAQNVAASNDIYQGFLDCIARTIARVAIQQMTAATVDWINSGFDGKPAFVQDYEAFFTDVADRAAGEFIQGSDLAFLCSPFQLQVRIAIAQSYASRRSGSENSCTLTNAVSNMENFLNGDFSAGGWPGLISLTTMPTNNPYGAFMYAQAGLENAQGQAVNAAGRDLSYGRGFLSFKEEYGCSIENYEDFDDGLKTRKTGCKYRITTPGVAIEQRVQQVLDLPIDQNLLADSFDEIVGALINQLVIRTMQNGFSNLSGARGYQSNFTNPVDAAAAAASQQLLINLQGAVSLAQQYGVAQQGSISDIQNAQAQLVSLENCWSAKNQDAQANTAAGQVEALESRIAVYNNNIVRANAATTKVQQLQTSALSATSLVQVQAAASAFSAAQNSGVLISQAEVTSAQQNRTTLQSEMAALNTQTSAKLNQCNAS